MHVLVIKEKVCKDVIFSVKLEMVGRGCSLNSNTQSKTSCSVLDCHLPAFLELFMESAPLSSDLYNFHCSISWRGGVTVCRSLI
jgi:hypothetical protein